MSALHLGRRALLAFDAQELGARRLRKARAHLSGCGRCRAQLTRLRALRVAAAEVTAPAAPDVLARILERIDHDEVLLLPGAESAAARRAAMSPLGRRSAAMAVGTLALLAGSVAAAVTLTPIRDWILAHVPAVAGAGGPEAPQPASGVSLAPGSELVIDVTGGAPDVRLVLTPGTSEFVDVTGVGAAATARYRSADGRLAVMGLEGGELRIAVPRSAPSVFLTAGSDTLVAVGNGAMRLSDGSAVTHVDAPLSALVPVPAPRGVRTGATPPDGGGR